MAACSRAVDFALSRFFFVLYSVFGIVYCRNVALDGATTCVGTSTVNDWSWPWDATERRMDCSMVFDGDTNYTSAWMTSGGNGDYLRVTFSATYRISAIRLMQLPAIAHSLNYVRFRFQDGGSQEAELAKRYGRNMYDEGGLWWDEVVIDPARLTSYVTIELLYAHTGATTPRGFVEIEYYASELNGLWVRDLPHNYLPENMPTEIETEADELIVQMAEAQQAEYAQRVGFNDRLQGVLNCSQSSYEMTTEELDEGSSFLMVADVQGPFTRASVRVRAAGLAFAFRKYECVGERPAVLLVMKWQQSLRMANGDCQPFCGQVAACVYDELHEPGDLYYMFDCVCPYNEGCVDIGLSFSGESRLNDGSQFEISDVHVLDVQMKATISQPTI